MNRRHVVAAGIGTAAALAGAGLAWWRLQPGGEEPPAGFWAQRFERPEGGELVLQDLRGGPLLLNFWATWCPPCIAEMPMLDAFHREHRAAGWRVVGLAVDGPTPVREFLARKPMGFPVGLAGLEGVALSRSLGNASGALPFTVVFDAVGRVVERKLGALHADDLKRWTAATGTFTRA